MHALALRRLETTGALVVPLRARMRGQSLLDFVRCEALVASVLGGDACAWTPLVGLLCPAVLGYAKSSRSLGHRRSDDDVREVMTTVLERLKKTDFRAL